MRARFDEITEDLEELKLDLSNFWCILDNLFDITSVKECEFGKAHTGISCQQVGQNQ